MENSLILKLRNGESFASADIDRFRLAFLAFMDGSVPIERSLRLTRSDHIKERDRYLLELGLLLNEHGQPQPRVMAMSVAGAISIFQRRKWPDSRKKNIPPPDFTKEECLLFWAHKVMPKMPSEKQLTNIFCRQQPMTS